MIRAATSATLLLLLLPFTAGAQTIVRSFDGDTGPEQQNCNPDQVTCGRQAEMITAASGQQLVQVTWQHVNVYDYTARFSIPQCSRISSGGPAWFRQNHTSRTSSLTSLSAAG